MPFQKGHKDFRTPEGLKRMGEKMRLILKGRKITWDTPTSFKKGHAMSLETREKISINNGRGMLGKHQTEVSKEKNRLAHIGIKQSKETIEKKRLANLGQKRSPEFCLKMSLKKPTVHSLEARQKMRNSRLNYMESGKSIMYNTRPELKMKDLLDKLGVEYVFQKRILDYFVDFFIPSKNLIIEVDGNYWHNYPYGTEKDKIRDIRLKAEGYEVLRFWESDILKMEAIQI